MHRRCGRRAHSGGPQDGRGRGEARVPAGGWAGGSCEKLGGSARCVPTPVGPAVGGGWAGGDGPARGPRRWPGRGRRKLGTAKQCVLTGVPRRQWPGPSARAGGGRVYRAEGGAWPRRRPGRPPRPGPRAPPGPSPGIPGFCPSQSRRCTGPRFLDVCDMVFNFFFISPL